MRTILTITILIALVWSGYWYIGAQAMQDGTQRWFADQTKYGWNAQAGKVETGGFPYRFDTTITGLELGDPAGNWNWSAPSFQFLALSYQPTHFIAFWPERQQVSVAGQTLEVTSTQLKASAVFKPDPSFELERSNIAANDLKVVSDMGWSLSLREGLLATRPDEADETAHEFGLKLTEVILPEALRTKVDPDASLPPVISQIAADATLWFDAPWNRAAIEGSTPQITAITLKSSAARWGNLSLSATGDVTVDMLGHATGQITVTARNWRKILDLAANAGYIRADQVPTIARALQPLADRAQEPGTIELPINLSDGMARIGVIPLGPAPRLILP